MAQSPASPGGARALVLLDDAPGDRHAALGVASGLRRVDALAGVLELADVRREVRAGAGHPREALRAAGEKLLRLCERHRVTRVVSIGCAGALEAGLYPGPDGRPVSPFALAGVRHVMLWATPPDVADDGAAVRPGLREVLASPLHTHVFRSESAADEARAVLGWPGVHALPWATDATREPPPADTPRAHDAVLVADARAPIPAELAPFLDEHDPDPVSMMDALRPLARERFRKACEAHVIGDLDLATGDGLCEAWIAARLGAPHAPFVRLAERPGRHADALARWRDEPALWYACVGALRTLVDWRRPFWGAWLARRADVLIAAAPVGAHGWVAPERRAALYAGAGGALSINAGHDEAGLGAEAFEIAGAGAPLVSHAGAEQGALFEAGEEAAVFERGPDLLESVRRFARDDAARRRAGEAARARVEREHDWAHRAASILEAAASDDDDAPRAAAA